MTKKPDIDDGLGVILFLLFIVCTIIIVTIKWTGLWNPGTHG